MYYSGMRMVQALVDLFLGLAEIILGLRVIFRLFAANPDSEFVRWIYDTSGALLAPFRGIFPTAEVSPGHVLDISALFAMLAYGVLAYIVLAIIGWLPEQKSRGYRITKR